jgi:hypothetical protein
MSYLYSKLPETGVSPHIGTGGPRWIGLRPRDSRKGRESGSSRCEMQKLAARYFHDVPSINWIMK